MAPFFVRILGFPGFAVAALRNQLFLRGWGLLVCSGWARHKGLIWLFLRDLRLNDAGLCYL